MALLIHGDYLSGLSMLRTFRYPLYPTPAQEAVLSTWLRACCALYNGALQERRDAWRLQKKRIRLFDQTKSLTEIRAVDPAFAGIPVEVTRSALRRVNRAFEGFFRRVKARAKAPGYPRFRSSRRYDSFSLQGAAPVRDGRVMLPKLGGVKLKLYRPLRGKVLDVTVRREATGRWYVCFVCDLGAAPPKVDVATVPAERVVGLDVGLRALVTLSTGESVDHPRHATQAAATLARRQRTVARRKKGSASRRRAVRLVARAYAHVRNQRLDHARKIAAWLVSRFDVISFEDLAVSQMVHGNLAFSIHDAGWRMLLQAIEHKAECAGAHAVAVDPRGTSQRCSGCDATVSKTLAQRTHRCPYCGLVLDRDHNAALNICALGWSAVTEPGAVDPARSEGQRDLTHVSAS